MRRPAGVVSKRLVVAHKTVSKAGCRLPTRFSVRRVAQDRRRIVVNGRAQSCNCGQLAGCTYIGQVEIEGVLFCEYVCPGPTTTYIRC
jgi:hypothetical protein